MPNLRFGHRNKPIAVEEMEEVLVLVQYGRVWHGMGEKYDWLG